MKKKETLSYKLRRKKRIKTPILYSKKNLNPSVVISFKKNNFFFNILGRLKKKPGLFSNVYWVSAGSTKFSKPQYKGSTKKTFVAHLTLSYLLTQKLNVLKIKNDLTIFFKGGSKHLRPFLRTLKKQYKRRFQVSDITPIPLNGCRLPKTRRI